MTPEERLALKALEAVECAQVCPYCRAGYFNDHQEDCPIPPALDALRALRDKYGDGSSSVAVNSAPPAPTQVAYPYTWPTWSPGHDYD